MHAYMCHPEVMSEKATGFDWRCRSKVRVVHAAGAVKYIGS